MESRQHQLVRDQLSKVLTHPIFSSKKRLSAFLEFVVVNSMTGEISRLKESLIGVEVYGRDPSYNPKLTPIVRTEARRLRACSEEYYGGDGSLDPVVIDIPKGSYVAQFKFQDLAQAQSTGPDVKLLTVEPEPAPPPNVPLHSQPSWFNGRLSVRPVFGLLGICVLAAGALSFINTSHRKTVWSAKPFSRLGGIEEFSSFSPDGQKLAFVWSGPKGDNRDIYVQDLKADVPTRLTTNPLEDNRPAWSPDGKQIAFIRLDGKGQKEVNVISLGTGKETKVAELEGMTPWLCVIPRISWSRDGRYLFTTENLGMGEACGVVAINTKNHSVQRITQPPPGIIGDLEPAVSPNGKQVAFLRNAGLMGGDLYLVGIDGGPIQRVTFDNRDILGFSWSRDGRSLIEASRRGNGVVKLWEVELVTHHVEQLTDGTQLASFPAVAPQGDRIAFTAYRNITSIWRADEAGNTVLISADSANSDPQLSPDGKQLVFRSDRTGSLELWTSDANGHSPKRLTHFNGPMVNSPAWSPDGTQIAFECRPEAHSSICLIASDGSGEVRRFTHWASNQSLPSWSRNGRFIYFASNYSGRWEIYKQAVAGGDPIAITHHGGARAVESWDGRYVYVHRGEPLGGMLRLPVAPTSEQETESSECKVFLPELTGSRWGDWDAGPNGVVFLQLGPNGAADRVALYDPENGAVRTLHPINGSASEGDRLFSVGPDGKSFLYVRTGHFSGEIEMMERQSQSGM